MGPAHCETGTVVLAFDNGSTVILYNLDAASKSDVKILLPNKKHVSVSPGQEVLLTKDPGKDFAQLNPGSGIAYKKPREHDLGDGIRAFDAEINITSALSSVKPLRQLVSSTKPGDQKIVRQLIRNSIILMQL